MNLRAEQDLLAKLYTDPELRNRFLRDPVTVGGECGVEPETSTQLASAAGDELEFFSQTLFWKRFNEVTKMLPESREAFGEEFEAHFREFSAGFVPDSIKKHLEDAYEFTSFLLSKREHVSAVARDRARLGFYGYARCLVLNLKSRPFVQLRIGKREFCW